MNEMLVQNNSIFNELLYNMLKVVAFESVRNQWSISRPMLGLILSSPEGYQLSKRRIVEGLPYHKQEYVAVCFDKLLADVDLKSLASSNRDKFTQRLTEARVMP